MARPRGGDWLDDEINNLRNNAVDLLVSLLERSEIHGLDLSLEEKLCLSKGIAFVNFPIPDRGIPEQRNAVDELIREITTKLDGGLSVVIHCRMGIGRSAIVAAAVLLNYDLRANDIVDTISRIRGLNVPDTDEQLNWLKDRAWTRK